MALVAAADAAAEATAATAVAAATTKQAGQQQWHGKQQVCSLHCRVLMFFSNKFISYVASYVAPPIQTGFLMAFRPRLRLNRNHDSGRSIRATGAEKTGLQRIPAGIINLERKSISHWPPYKARQVTVVAVMFPFFDIELTGKISIITV